MPARGANARARGGCSPGTAARAYTALRDSGVLAGSRADAFVVARRRGARAARWRGDPARFGWPAATIPPSTSWCARPGNRRRVVAGPRGSVNGIVQLARGGCGRHGPAPAGRGQRPLERPHRSRRARRRARRARASLAARAGAGARSRQPARHQRRRRPRRPADRVAPPGHGVAPAAGAPDAAAGCVPHPELGEPAESHLAVAAAVATGAADAGLAVRAVAESAGLEWVPVVDEPFELALDPAARAPRRRCCDAAGERCSAGSDSAAMPGYDLSM